MKNTPIDTAREEKRKAAIEALKARGLVSNEKSIAALRKRVALIEEILGRGNKIGE